MDFNASSIGSIVQVATPTSPQVAGMIIVSGGLTVPAGWTVCNGSALDKTLYPELFSCIGAIWDTCINQLTGLPYSAPGGNLFRLPDLRGTFTVNEDVISLIKLYDDAGAIVMSGSPFVGSEFQPVSIAITGDNDLRFSRFYTCDDAVNSTQTVPSATGSNMVITVENTGDGDVTVAAQSGESINGLADKTISKYESLKIRDYATGKYIVMY